MKKITVLFFVIAVLLTGLFVYNAFSRFIPNTHAANIAVARSSHWFLLQRRSQKEFLYYGTPGDQKNSALIRTFTVKTGQPGKKPTPLPSLVGKEYWRIVDKFDSSDNPETAPYFLAFDTASGASYPYGPEPYLECNGQCNWELPGYFGLHGVAGQPDKLADADPGSSGCVRHTDQDIEYLYNLLDPKKEEIRYYIRDI